MIVKYRTINQLKKWLNNPSKLVFKNKIRQAYNILRPDGC